MGVGSNPGGTAAGQHPAAGVGSNPAGSAAGQHPTRGGGAPNEFTEEDLATWLNGTRMIDLTDAKIGEATGQIALQIHSGGGIKVRWRDLRVREILDAG